MAIKNINMKTRHGYLAIPRQATLLLEELGCELFGIYLTLVMKAPWDRRNENFGRIVKTQVQLGKELNMHQSTISRKLDELEKHRYCILRHQDQGYMTLGYFPLFLHEVTIKIINKNYADLNELYADMYRINAKLQEDYAAMQDK